MATALLAACASSRPARAPSPDPVPPFTTTIDRDAPLVGRIWDVQKEAFVAPPSLLARLAAARYVLLGEQHDNPDHHRLQAWIVRSLAREGRRPSLAFEMIESVEQPDLDEYLAMPGASADGVGTVVSWSRSGWPPFEQYEPIVEAALEAGLPVVAANLPRAQVRLIVRDGAHGIPASLAAGLDLDRPLAAPLEASLEQELRASHCGALPTGMIRPMALAQRARDASMATWMTFYDRGDGAVLIAGSGHARSDRGVPLELRRKDPKATIATVAFAEVDRDARDPRGYAKRWNADRLPFDFVWFTPRASDADPCASMRAERP